MADPAPHRVVLVGGGFGGLYTAKALRRAPVEITLVDRRNFHLFQPLLYWVATGGLSPANIASPLRAVLRRQRNVRVVAAEVVDLLPDKRQVVLRDGALPYDTLVVATGAGNHYFGHDEWAPRAPALKTLEDATAIRAQVLLSFEAAERETDPDEQQAWLTFVVVGGGATGVELAGALGELAHFTLRHEFRRIDPTRSRILLLEALDRLLPAFPQDLSTRAGAALRRKGVTICTRTMVTAMDPDAVTVRSESGEERIRARTILWAAGVKASPLGKVIAERTGAALDRAGRLIVNPDLTLPNHPEILVVGDLASYVQDGKPLPGVAPVAMQQGQYAADLIRARRRGQSLAPFRYQDKGNLAVIGRNAAVADLGRFRFSGFVAWVLWVFVHINYLIAFDTKIIVLFQWAWNYVTRQRGARLITGANPLPQLHSRSD